MSFDVAAEAYEAFMGRWSRQLSPPFLERSGLRRGDRALDVGCGPGILTEPLVAESGKPGIQLQYLERSVDRCLVV